MRFIGGWNPSVLGTDINRPFLAQATEGQFEEWAFRGTAPELRGECFEQLGKTWQIAPRFREGVAFQYHNLVRHPCPSLVHDLLAFDLILRRNVLIHFAPEIIERIISQLKDCLAPGGWLAVGHAEHSRLLNESFEVVSCHGATLYRKPDSRPTAWEPQSTVPKSNFVVDSTSTADSPSPGSINLRCNAQEVIPRQPSHVEPPPVSRVRNSAATTQHPNVLRIRTLADQGEVESALRLCETWIEKIPRICDLLLLSRVAAGPIGKTQRRN